MTNLEQNQSNTQPVEITAEVNSVTKALMELKTGISGHEAYKLAINADVDHYKNKGIDHVQIGDKVSFDGENLKIFKETKQEKDELKSKIFSQKKEFKIVEKNNNAIKPETNRENKTQTLNIEKSESRKKFERRESRSVGPLNREEVVNIKNALAQRESRNRPWIVNTLGYAGKYQFGAAALEDTNFLKKGSYKKFGQSAMKNPNNWRRGWSLEKFLSDESLQEKAMNKLLKRNYRTLKRIGKINRHTSKESVAGKLCQAHLGGAGNVDKNFADAYGSKVSEYDQIGRSALV